MNTKKIVWGLSKLTLTCVLSCTLLQAQSGNEVGKSASDAQAAPATQPATSPSGIATDDATYVIGVEDVLLISVWKEPEVSRVVPVRSDGKISLALVGEVTAGGKTPKELKVEITEKLKSFISEPEVTVIVQEMRSKKFNVMGMVTRPGSFPLNGSMTVLDALAVGGGFRDFAKKKAIYVLRKKTDGTDERLPFNYNDVIKGKNSQQNVRLMPGDTVVVP
jgi:polysaccharide export outer membrane protein